MFSRWTKRAAASKPITVAQLEALAPFAESSLAELHVALGDTERVSLGAGESLGDQQPGRLYFIEQGQLHIATRADARISLVADTPSARFPLPAQDKVRDIVAEKPSTLLKVPDGAARDRPVAQPQPPDLNPTESQALSDLRAYFASAHYELPNLPDLAMKIGNAIDSSTTTSDDIARLIQLDPVLSTRILSVVNSAAFGGVSRVTSIPQATTRLGRRKVRSLVFSCLLKSIFKIQSPLLKRHMELLWERSAHVAALSYVLGRATPGIDAEQALLAGLIHDIGAIAVIGGVSHFPLLAEREALFDYVLDLLREEAATRIVAHWGLQSEFGDVVTGSRHWYRNGSAIAEIADVVIIARLHAAIGEKGHEQLPFIDSVPAFAKLVDGELTPKRSLAVLEKAAADVREIESLLSS